MNAKYGTAGTSDQIQNNRRKENKFKLRSLGHQLFSKNLNKTPLNRQKIMIIKTVVLCFNDVYTLFTDTRIELDCGTK